MKTFKQIKYPQKISKKAALNTLKEIGENDDEEAKLWTEKFERCPDFWETIFKYQGKPILKLRQQIGSGKTTAFQLFYEEDV